MACPWGWQQGSCRVIELANEPIASKLGEMADILQQQQADGYRISAYRRAATTLRELARPIEDIVRSEGLAGVVELPGIGRGIGAAIVEMVTTGRWAQLERLAGTLQPEQLFRTIPGIGPGLATRIHEELHIDSLEQLEDAAHDGRLGKVSGIGERRAASIRAALSERLGHRRIRLGSQSRPPAIELLLDVDREYRVKAAAGQLRTIAPKRFNPTGEAWLPVLHCARGDWQFTALFSNTQKAHELHKTNDWVVIYFHTVGEPEAQCTVVTEAHGALAARRVVRGREGECAAHYAAKSSPAA
jgi:DNA polymerase (family X)